MAKKTKRAVRREAYPSIEKPVADPLATNRPTGFNPDYHYVIRDLRRVGLLAGSFIIVLLALSILLH
jgi:hypothetical protein